MIENVWQESANFHCVAVGLEVMSREGFGWVDILNRHIYTYIVNNKYKYIATPKQREKNYCITESDIKLSESVFILLMSSCFVEKDE